MMSPSSKEFTAESALCLGRLPFAAARLAGSVERSRLCDRKVVYQQLDADHYARIAKIPTAIGARTSAYYGQVGKHNSLYLSVPGRADRAAELWVFETRD